jgi:Fe-S-cluster-containing dehydrogenase component/DMSO reductase anchor subunit
MMRKGFLFDHNRCVGCGACKAGCFNENGWPVNVRDIFIKDEMTSSSVITMNLSMGCNHCETAECMQGCPASCFSRDELSGAVIIDDNKCLGCKYCIWNCPYDAPKFDKIGKTIVKCNFCVNRLRDGYSPACTLACPTGALGFGEIKTFSPENTKTWFPDKDLNPAIQFRGKTAIKPLKIIPGNLFGEEIPEDSQSNVFMDENRSLAVFSFIATLSVSVVVTSLLKGVFPGLLVLAPLLILAVVSSMFHLGKWTRAWRAVNNFKTSPLSREIFFFLAFSCCSVAAILLRIRLLMPVSSVLGLILLLTVDRVYSFADNRKQVLLHSGQTFISSLLIISFVSGMMIPFIFISLIRISSSFYIFSHRNDSGKLLVMRYIRIALLVLAGAAFISGRSHPGPEILVLLLAGELLDRLLFYADFSPLNIKTSIKNHININQNDKKGN